MNPARASAASTSRSRAGSPTGRTWLNIKFDNGLLRVPFRVMTKDEQKFLNKNYKSIRQQVKDAFAPPKK